MPSLIDLRRRIRAVKSTQQITKAMKMIAASRLRRAQDRVIASRPYAQRMLQVLQGLASRVDPEAHPLLQRGSADGRPLVRLPAPRRTSRSLAFRHCSSLPNTHMRQETSPSRI